MSTNYFNSPLRPGEVESPAPLMDPPISSLVSTFQGRVADAAESIVLRGYLGRSEILQRALAYLDRARGVLAQTQRAVGPAWLAAAVAAQPGPPAAPAAANIQPAVRLAIMNAAQAAGVTQYQANRLATLLNQGMAAATAGDIAGWLTTNAGLNDVQAQGLARQIIGIGMDVVDYLINTLRAVEDVAFPHIPWRLYLTPRLDRYVDFHRSSILAYRREAKAERQDACTVWLRSFETVGNRPILYRVVHETTLGPSYAEWIGGRVVDDYVEQPSSSSAWGAQAGIVGHSIGTTIRCGEW